MAFDEIFKIVKDNGGSIDIEDQDLNLYNGDTEEEAGEVFQALSVQIEDGTLYCSMSDGDDWDVSDFSDYELNMLSEAIEDKLQLSGKRLFQ